MSCDDIGYCICCLQIRVKLLRVDNKYDGLLELLSKESSPCESSIKWLCLYCANFMRRLEMFREMCLQSKILLQKYSIHQITVENKDIKIPLNCIQLTVSNTLRVDVSTSEASETKVDIFYSNNYDSPKNFMRDMVSELERVKQEPSIEFSDEFVQSQEQDVNDGLSDDSIILEKLKKISISNTEIKCEKNLKKEHKFHKNKYDKLCSQVKEECFEDTSEKTCDYCNIKFFDSTKYKKHRKTCKNKRNKLRNIQKKIAKLKKKERSSSLKKESFDFHSMKIHKTDTSYKCKDCEKEFNLPCVLKRHSVIHSTSRPFSCPDCKKTFRRPGDLKKHKLVHSGVKPYICDVCGHNFSGLGNLKCHLIRKHSVEKTFPCQECAKMFKTESEVKRHSRVHTGEKPFACDLCGQAFALSGNLKTHRRIHTGEKPYICTYCNSSFSDASYLKKHKRIHTGEKPYHCDMCNLTFSTAGGRKTHSVVHTHIKPFSCNECSYTTSRTTHLKRHKKTHKTKIDANG